MTSKLKKRDGAVVSVIVEEEGGDIFKLDAQKNDNMENSNIGSDLQFPADLPDVFLRPGVITVSLPWSSLKYLCAHTRKNINVLPTS